MTRVRVALRVPVGRPLPDLAAFIARRSVLLSNAARSAIRVIGSRFSPEAAQVREFLTRSHLPHEWMDPDNDAAVATIDPARQTMIQIEIEPLNGTEIFLDKKHVRFESATEVKLVVRGLSSERPLTPLNPAKVFKRTAS